VNEITIQRKLLKLMLLNKEITSEASKRLASKMFTSEYAKWFYEKITEYFIRFGHVPTIKILLDILNKNIQDSKIIDEYKLFLNKIKDEEIKTKESNYFIEAIIEAYTKLETYNILQSVVEKMEKPNANVFSEIENMQLKLGQLSYATAPTPVQRTEIVSGLLERLELYEKFKYDSEGIPTGITELDNHIGGFHKGELILLIGGTGEGKSAILLNFATAAYLKAHSIIFVTMEMTITDVMVRYHSRISGLNHTKIRKHKLDPLEERELYSKIIMNALKKQDRDKFKKWFASQSLKKITIKELYGEVAKQFQFKDNRFYFLDLVRDCTIEKIEIEIKQLMRGHSYDAVYLDHLNTIETSHKSNNWVRDIGIIARKLKNLAKELNVPIVIPCQMVSKKEGEEITAEDVKYAKAISENADWVIGFKQSEEDKMTGIINLELAKHRHAEKIIVKARENFSRMKISNFEDKSGYTIKKDNM